MGVYIRGMNIPPNGLGIGVMIRSDGTVDTFCIDKTDETVMFVNRTEWKAIPVPVPHGRLIDADAMIKEIKRWEDHPNKYIRNRNEDFIFYLNDTETVVESEE